MRKDIKRIIVVTFAAISIYGCASAPPRSDQFIPLVLNAPIPDGYDSYTLLLFPDYKTKFLYNDDQVKMIDESFKFFGKEIGKNNLASYFLNADKRTHSVERAIEILDKMNMYSIREITYSSAPIIIYANFNPERQKPSWGFVTAIAFRGADANTITGVLSRLTQLIRESKVHGYTLEYQEMALQMWKFIERIKIEINISNVLVIRYQ